MPRACCLKTFVESCTTAPVAMVQARHSIPCVHDVASLRSTTTICTPERGCCAQSFKTCASTLRAVHGSKLGHAPTTTTTPPHRAEEPYRGIWLNSATHDPLLEGCRAHAYAWRRELNMTSRGHTAAPSPLSVQEALRKMIDTPPPLRVPPLCVTPPLALSQLRVCAICCLLCLRRHDIEARDSGQAMEAPSGQRTSMPVIRRERWWGRRHPSSQGVRSHRETTPTGPSRGR